MIQAHSPAAINRLPYAYGAYSTDPNFTIYMGKDKHKLKHRLCNNQLPIHNIVYETLVEGIESATEDKDFKGVLTVRYQYKREPHSIVFAMWFSTKHHLYFLTSLGQYSLDSYKKEIEQFKTSQAADIHIQLSLIHRSGLEHLQSKLAKSNLPRANVCLLENTIYPA
jgi:hypothetical protein